MNRACSFFYVSGDINDIFVAHYSTRKLGGRTMKMKIRKRSRRKEEEEREGG